MNLKAIVRWTFKLGFVAAVTTLAWFNVSASIMAICATVLVVLGGKIESLVEFSFGPLKAKIERNLSESETLLNGLKTFAAIQARAANQASAHTGRFASGDDWIFRSVKEIEQGLWELGVDETHIVDARREFVLMTVGDMGQATLGLGRVPTHLPKEAEAEWRQVLSESRMDPDAIETYLAKWGELSPERAQRIAEMRWMLSNTDVRDSRQYMLAHTAVDWPSAA